MIRKIALCAWLMFAVALIALPAQAATPAPFAPNPNNSTVNIAVTASSTTVSVPSSNNSNYVLTNVGTNVIFVEFGNVGTTPVASATTSMALLPNSQVVVTAPQNTVVAVIAASTGNTLYITPGSGE